MHPQSALFGCVSSHTLNIITGLLGNYQNNFYFFSLRILEIFVCWVLEIIGSISKEMSRQPGENDIWTDQSGELRKEPAGPGRGPSQRCPSSSATGYEIKSSRGREPRIIKITLQTTQTTLHCPLPTFNISHCVGGGREGGFMKVNKAQSYIIYYKYRVQCRERLARTGQDSQRKVIWSSTSSVSARHR